MNKSDFITKYIVEGLGGLREAEAAWKEYREENGGGSSGFNSMLAEALLEGPMTEDEYEDLIDRISPNPDRPYGRQNRWIWKLVQDVRNQYN
jgi:hypothetical protein